MKLRSIVKTVSLGLATMAAVTSLNTVASDYSETVVRTSADGVRTAHVPYGDLDLSAAAGRDALASRVEGAARLVCGPLNLKLAGSLADYADNRSCFNHAVTRAMGQVDTGNEVAVASR
jgi:UrcA family protein